MNKCSIDCGSSLIKAAVKTSSGFKFFSTASMTKEELVQSLKDMGVSSIYRTGIGKFDLPFTILNPERDIFDENDNQVLGAKHLLQSWKGTDDRETRDLIPTSFLLASLGTGANFISVLPHQSARLKFGSPFAGGFLSKIANHIIGQRDTFKSDSDTMKTLDTMALYALQNNIAPSDLLISDLMKTGDEEIDRHIISSCGKLNPPFPWREISPIAVSLINMAATAILDKILMYRYAWVFNSEQVVLIGSLAALPSFQLAFRRAALEQGFTSYFLPNGEYANAIGAILSAEKKEAEKQFSASSRSLLDFAQE